MITITENKIVAKNIHKISATIDPATPLAFKAGQFCMVNIPTSQERTTPRAYSFASDPHNQETVSFYIKILRDENEHIASPYFETCKPGNTLTIQPPSGHMILPETLPELIVYCATTTGIAPFLAHLHHLAKHNPKQYVDVLFGCRNQEDVFAQSELEYFQTVMPNLSVTTAITQPTNSWKQETGRITTFLDQYSPDLKTIFYLCGNKYMIIDARKQLLNQNHDASSIKFEIFY